MNRFQSIRFQLVKKFSKLIFPAYRYMWPQVAWWNNSNFNDYLVKFKELDGLNTYRRWMLYQLIRMVHKIPGDTAECGVYEGASSYLICRANSQNKFHHREHHLFDSFEGLSEPSKLDGGHWKKNDLASPVEILKKNISEFSEFRIHKGWIPDRFLEVKDKKFCLVHIDVDLYQPTKDSLEFFYPRLESGGILVCDDYGFTTCPGATQACDQFLSEKKEKMIAMAGGGGFIIKGIETSA